MRHHPIPAVTEPLQYRAIGLVRGVYQPADPSQLTRGVIRTADDQELEAVVLGRLLTLMRRHLDLSRPHLWVVYPRSREEGGLHLQMVGIWEPSTLAAGQQDAAADAEASGEAEASADAELAADAEPAAEAGRAAAPAADDSLPEGDDYFSVRGELVFTKPETGDLVVKVRQLPRADGQRPAPFKLQLRGEVPLQHLRHFVALDLRRRGQTLELERLEVIGPVSQRGSRGGKDRGGRDRGKSRDSRPGRDGRPGRDSTASGGPRGEQRRQPQGPRSAVVRPSR